MHPVDNVSFNYSSPTLHMDTTNPTKGTAWHFAHFYAASCEPAYSGGNKSPWVTCPTGSSRQPFTCTTPQHKILHTLSTNVTTYFPQRLDHKGFAAVGTIRGTVVTRVVYTWQETSNGLEITQDIVFGSNGHLAAPNNLFGLQAMFGRTTKGDTQLGLAQLVLHEMEIVGWYSEWLPAVYQAETARSWQQRQHPQQQPKPQYQPQPPQPHHQQHP